MFGYENHMFATPWMILLWVVVIALVVYFITRLIGGNKDGGRRSSYLQILKERYARGEISENEYERIKSKLLQDDFNAAPK